MWNVSSANSSHHAVAGHCSIHQMVKEREGASAIHKQIQLNSLRKKIINPLTCLHFLFFMVELAPFLSSLCVCFSCCYGWRNSKFTFKHFSWPTLPTQETQGGIFFKEGIQHKPWRLILWNSKMSSHSMKHDSSCLTWSWDFSVAQVTQRCL